MLLYFSSIFFCTMRKGILLEIFENNANYFKLTIGYYSNGYSISGYHNSSYSYSSYPNFGSLNTTNFNNSTIYEISSKSDPDYNYNMGRYQYIITDSFSIKGNSNIKSTIYIKRLDTNALLTIPYSEYSSITGLSLWWNKRTSSVDNPFFDYEDRGKTIDLYIGFEEL